MTPARRRLRALSAALTTGAAAPPPHRQQHAAPAGGSAAAPLAWKERPVGVGDLMMGCAFVNSKRGREAADDAEAAATVLAAIEHGIRDFDTAPYYGPSEGRVGRALAAAAPLSAGGQGADLRMWTKVGVVRDGATVAELGASAYGARTSFAESTERLGVTSLAGLRFHDIPDDKGPLDTTDLLIAAAAGPDGMVAGLRALRDEGLISEVSHYPCLTLVHPQVSQ